MLHVNGVIYDEIAIVSSVEQPVYRSWEESQDAGEKEMVTPAFVCDANNSKTMGTAIAWAERARNYYDHALRKSITKADPVKKEIRKNAPISGLRVVNLEHRGQGGRAYKVITPDNYYFDLREDVLLETLISVGVRKGGILNGKFIWARLGTTSRLVRVGSELHQALEASTSKRSLSNIDPKDLIVGGVYENKKNERFLFLGFVDIFKYSYRLEYNVTTGNALSSHGNYAYTTERRLLTNHMLWFTIPNKKVPIETILKENMASYYWFSLKKDKFPVVRHVDTITLPENHIEKIKNANLDNIREIVNNSMLMAHRDKIPQLCMSSELCCMAPHGQEIVLDQMYDELIP